MIGSPSHIETHDQALLQVAFNSLKKGANSKNKGGEENEQDSIDVGVGFVFESWFGCF